MTTNLIEIEYKLLGSYMTFSDVFNDVEHLVKPNIFTTPFTKTVYEIIKEYHDKGIQSDNVSVFNALVKKGFSQSDCSQVAMLEQSAYIPPTMVKEYVIDLFNQSIGRYLYPIMKAQLGSADPMSAMLTIKDAILNVDMVVNNVSKEKGIYKQFDETIQRIIDLKTKVIERAGFSWGIPSLDYKTLGIVQGINVVAADKGGGKSSLVINIIVENVFKNSIPLLFFSMEMTAIEVLTNVIANIQRINSKALRTGQVDDNEIKTIKEIKNKLNESFVIDETGGITWQYFESKVRAHRKKHKIPPNVTMLVVLDYLGLMKNSSDESRMSKEERIEQICTELMRICKNENIALVKLAQFSREASRRGNDSFNVKTDEDRLRALRPKMGDLKGSSAIESNAVTILMLYRPEYYGILQSNGTDFRELCEINIVKGRYVNPGPVYAKFQGKFNLFEDYVLPDNGIKTEGEEPAF